jgi:RNA polymerase sigma-70 factor (ECF subfamily)
MSTKSARLGAKLWLVPGSPPSPSSVPPAPPTPALDDSELLAALSRGDPSAATALHDRLRPQVDRSVRRLLGSHDPDLRDLVQQAMIEVVFTIGTYRGDCSLDSWTSAVAAHVVYKHIRRRRIERRIFNRLDPELLIDVRSPSRTGREALVRNTLQRVLKHLDAVDEVKAWTFVLHDVCGYDLREIGKITGVSTAAAQTRLIRGRREVHERIATDPELANLLESIGGAR